MSPVNKYCVLEKIIMHWSTLDFVYILLLIKLFREQQQASAATSKQNQPLEAIAYLSPVVMSPRDVPWGMYGWGCSPLRKLHQINGY